MQGRGHTRTSIWHTRPPNFTDQPRDVIWQILTRKKTLSAKNAAHGGRLQVGSQTLAAAGRWDPWFVMAQ